MVVFPASLNSANNVDSFYLHEPFTTNLGSSIKYHFIAFGVNFTLHVSRNYNLLTDEFVVERSSEYFRNSLSEQEFQSIDERIIPYALCYYVGVVRGYKNSSVALNVCNGLVSVLLL